MRWFWKLAPGVLVLALLGGAGAGCAPRRPEPPSAARMLAALDLPARVGQLVVTPLGGPGFPLDSAALAPLRERVRRGAVGGVEVRIDDAAQMAAALRMLRRAGAPAPLLAVARLEGGRVAAGVAEFPSPAALASLVPVDEARAAGLHLGRSARALGVDLALFSTAPTNGQEPLAVPARRPGRAAQGVAALVEGLEEGGTMAGVRALWATGPDDTLRWSRARLEAIEIAWIAAAREAGAQAVQLGAVRVPALTGDTVLLPFSPAAVHGLLRRDLGWDGVVVADLAPAGRLVRGRGEGEAAVRALAAGADLLLGVRDPARVIAAVVEAVRAGRLPRARVDQAAARVLALKERARSLPPPPPPTELSAHFRDPAARELAVRLAERLTVSLPGPDGPGTLSPADSGLVVATPVGRGQTLARLLKRQIPGAERLAVNLSADSAAVRSMLAAASRDAAVLVTTSFSGQGPALAGLAPPGDSAAREIRALFRPWSLEQYVGDGPAVVSWGVGPAAQQAAAHQMLGRSPPSAPPAALAWPPAPTLHPGGPGSAGMDAEALGRVGAILDEALEEGVFTGAALAVGRGGKLVLLRGYGEVDEGLPVDPQRTLFDLASLTKVVGTTTAAMLLVDDGLLELDAPVQRYLPEFQGGDKEDVTVRHLLTHTSGLPSGVWLYGEATSPAAALRRVIAQPLLRPPGERMEYSDLGMILMAEVIERASETPLDRLLARDLFGPLGMSSTQFLPPATLRERTVPTAARSERDLLIRGAVHDANAFRLGGVTGHAGLFSTARDVAVLAQTLLNGGTYGTVRVLSPRVVAAFSRKQPGADTRALGWDTPSRVSSAGRFFSARSFGHTGFTGTSLWIDPERELFVVLLTNRTFAEASSGQMLRVRAAVHDAVARAIDDVPVRPRPGARAP